MMREGGHDSKQGSLRPISGHKSGSGALRKLIFMHHLHIELVGSHGFRQRLPTSPCSTDLWSTPGPRHATLKAATALFRQVTPKGLSRRAGPPCRLPAQLPEFPATVTALCLAHWDRSLVQPGIDPSRVFNGPGLREAAVQSVATRAATAGASPPSPASPFPSPVVASPAPALQQLKAGTSKLAWRFWVSSRTSARKRSPALHDCPCKSLEITLSHGLAR